MTYSMAISISCRSNATKTISQTLLCKFDSIQIHKERLETIISSLPIRQLDGVSQNLHHLECAMHLQVGQRLLLWVRH